nr:MAG TPA: hypothetical protein [Caudoviricetes sp.]
MRSFTLVDKSGIPPFQSTPPAEGATANTANRLPAFTPLLQHILQDFASVRAIQRIKNNEHRKEDQNVKRPKT